MKKKITYILCAVILNVLLCSAIVISGILIYLNSKSQPSSTPTETDVNHIGLTLTADRNVLDLDDKVTGTAQLIPSYDEEEVSKIAEYLNVETVNFVNQWSSSDTSVVKVDASGKVTATGKGEAQVTVTAKIKGKTGVAGTAVYDFSVNADEDYYTITKGNSAFASNSIVVDTPGKWFFYCDQSSVINSMSAYFNRDAAHLSFEEISPQKEWYLRYLPEETVGGSTFALSFTLTLDTDAYIRYGGPKGYRYVEYYGVGTHEVTIDNLYFDGTTPFSICLLSEAPAGVDDKSEFKNSIIGGTFSFSVSGIKLEEQTLSLKETVASLDLTTEGQNTVSLVATNPLNDEPFVWTSSDESVAEVDQNGKVKGVGAGVAVITAALENGRHVSCRVTVITESITIYTPSYAIDLDAEDRTLAITAEVRTSDGEERVVIWTSSDTNVATVTQDGVVEGLAEGMVVITASTGTVSATCNISVARNPMGFGNNETAVTDAGTWYYWYDTKAISNNPVSVARCDRESGDITVTMNTASKTVQLKYQPEYEIGAYYSIAFTVTAPDGATFATFKYGTDGSLTDGLTAISGGVTTFSYHGTVDSSKPFIITFKTDAVGDIIISDIKTEKTNDIVTVTLENKYLTVYLAESSSVTLFAEVSDGGGIIWTSSDEETATVTQNGVVTLLKTGTVTITATSENAAYASASCIITVKDVRGDEASYSISKISSGGNGSFTTYRGYIAAGSGGGNVFERDCWYILAYSGTAAGYYTSAEFVGDADGNGVITIGYNQTVTKRDSYICLMPSDGEGEYSVSFTLTVQGEASFTGITCGTQTLTGSGNIETTVNVTSSEPIAIKISSLTGANVTITLSDIQIIKL